MPPTAGPTSAVRAVSGGARGAWARQWARIADAVDELSDSDLDAATQLPGWSVADLVAHLAAGLDSLVERLAAPRPFATFSVESRASVRAAVDRLGTILDGADLGRPFDELVVSSCVEGVIHGLDFEPAVEPDREALKIVTKALLAVLAAKAPGKSVEVRVPPFGAIQCVEGLRHTRGTPPNVVETDPLTWVRLASGRLVWSEVADDGRLRASGERSDITGLLPLL